MIGEVVAEMDYMRIREQKLRDTNESTNERVKWFAFGTMGMLVGLGAWQVVYLRAYFRYGHHFRFFSVFPFLSRIYIYCSSHIWFFVWACFLPSISQLWNATLANYVNFSFSIGQSILFKKFSTTPIPSLYHFNSAAA